MINNIEKELNILENNGSFFSIEDRIKIYKNITYILNNIKEYENIKKLYENRLEKITMDIINKKILFGIITSIIIDNDEIKVIKGTNSKNEQIIEDTCFDIASITKLFTLILYFILENEGVINKEEKVIDIMPSYKELKEYRIDDILNMHGEIRTKKRIDECKDKKEALNELKKTYLHDDNLNNYKYTDIGLIILATLIEEKVNKINNEKLNYSEIMNKYLLKRFNFKARYYPNELIASTGRKDNLVNDAKARIIGPTGHAGIFMPITDIKKIKKLLFNENILRKSQIDLLYKNNNKPKSIVGLYQKYIDISKTYVPLSFSKQSFASEGYTGSTLIFDLKNKIIDSILVDTIEIGNTVKRKGFKENISDYQKKVTDLTVEAKVLKNVYKQIYN